MKGRLPARHGLYDARFEHDGCGVGFVADIEGRRSHTILDQALTALGNLSHRGAVSADGKSGDGAGVLTQVPDALIRRELDARSVNLDADTRIAVGMFFLPVDRSARASCVAIAEREVERGALKVLAWRDVPSNPHALGEIARATCPHVTQLILSQPDGMADDAFERRLYLTRKRIERTVEAAGVGPLHVASMSSRTIVYKGLMVAEQVATFYPDLADPAFETAIAVFHQRFSTNTFATWPFAQPFRFLAHNGEINTLRGNVNRFKASAAEMVSSVWGEELSDLHPIIDEAGSDSAALDSVFELLAMSGRDPLHAMMMLIPEAYQQMREMHPDLGAFFEYHAALMAPWDGPAAIAFSDGRIAAAALDRNGLRPLRYWVTTGGTVIACSETGVVPIPPEEIAESGRLGPGKLFAVDTVRKRLLRDEEIKFTAARRRPYKEWVVSRMLKPKDADSAAFRSQTPDDVVDIVRMQKAFAYGAEDIERTLVPMVYEGKEPIGSMGDDTPIAALSDKPKTIYRYFKQIFAQVTNPPIDPLRERLVMSRRIALGGRSSLLDESVDAAALVKFDSPFITTGAFEWLLSLDHPRFRSATLRCLFPVEGGPDGLAPALDRLCESALRCAETGCTVLVLSDRGVNASWAPIPMLLATSAAHHHLIRSGKRMRVSLVCDTGDPRQEHHFACLLGFGAALIHPYLGLASVRRIVREDPRGTGIGLIDAVANYTRAIENGVLKIMSKMGISTISSYRGAQIFEAVGLAPNLVDRHFAGTVSRIGGLGLAELARDMLMFHAEAYGEDSRLADRGIYRYRKGGEYHANNPTITKVLHKAVRTQDGEAFAQYTRMVDERRPCHLRDLLMWKRAARPPPLDEVEPAESIARRFCTQAMSHGAISREAHEVLAIAMNRLGGRSNSGEGGEDPDRYRRYECDMPSKSVARWHPKRGDWGNSFIKQVASGRFGVTAEYLVNADELEIKMAQGAKPGEGGQILGDKVSEEIASLRRAIPGGTLISPPPHHDIYSIEDLGQLICDLKRVNPQARVGVKLVSVAGVGTIAAGVVKAYADVVQISGCDGGTGASPLSSMRSTGLPWELGLAEIQQVLVLNDLRGRVTLRVDGGIKTGRDVVMGALLGADEFGFGTAALVAAGCVMVRQCHLNTCPVGIATQSEALRRKFPGSPEHIVAFMLFVAEHVRMILAEMGFLSIEEIVGRVDLLEQRPNVALPKTPAIDLSAILAAPDPDRCKARRCTDARNDRPEETASLDEVVLRDCVDSIRQKRTIVRRYEISNRERSVGARLAGEIARQCGGSGLADGSVQLHFCGCAGQSFGAFCNRGMQLTLEGEAQDYVGKGMSGGTIVVKPWSNAGYRSDDAKVLMGNTVAYGATGGWLFVAGAAGERLAVRNSGGRIIVEGCGDHGCEYMTNGVVVVLGQTGRNFGAGMTGGVAYVYDEDGSFEARCHAGFVSASPVTEEADDRLLHALLERHLTLTGSSRTAWMIDRWSEVAPRFRAVSPHAHTIAAKTGSLAIKRQTLIETCAPSRRV